MTDAPAADCEALLAQADQAASKGEWEAAFDILVPAPDVVRVLDKRAFYLSRAKRYDEARAVLAVLRQMEPDNFLWQHMTGYQYYVEGRYDEAAPWLAAAYKLNRTHIRNLYRLAQTRRHQGDLVRAQRAGAEVLRLWHQLSEDGRQREAKTFAKASYLLARLQVDRDPRGAIELLRQAAENDPGDHDKHYLLGKTYHRIGERDPASEALRRARRLKPGRPYIELESAAVLAERGETDEARRCLSRVRGVRGWQAWKAARVAIELEAFEEAREWLKIAARDGDVKASPKFAEIKAAFEAATAQEARPQTSQEPRDVSDHLPHRGRVHHVKASKGFGFLVDGSDGARCHFKLRGNLKLSANDEVEFLRADTERGPAAREVRRVGVASATRESGRAAVPN